VKVKRVFGKSTWTGGTDISGIKTKKCRFDDSLEEARGGWQGVRGGRKGASIKWPRKKRNKTDTVGKGGRQELAHAR